MLSVLSYCNYVMAIAIDRSFDIDLEKTKAYSI